MSFIFYGLNALKYLDISNFNMSKCSSFIDIFSNINNIRYINIKNLNNDKAISNSFNNIIDLFYVCELLTIIDNINAYNFCLYNMTTDQCDEIYPTTIPMTIPTTIPTTIPSTFTNTVPTTFPIANLTTITTIINTLLPIINNTISTTMINAETISIFNNIPTTISTIIGETISSTKIKTDKAKNLQTNGNEQSLTTINVDDKTKNINISSSIISKKPEEGLTSQIALKTEQESTNITENIPQVNTISQTTNSIQNITVSNLEITESTIPPKMNNTYIFTTIKETYTNINEILSTIKEIPTTLPQAIINTSEIIENEETNVELLGFNQMRTSNNYFFLYVFNCN